MDYIMYKSKLTLLKPAILVFCLIFEPTGVIHEHCSQPTASSLTTDRPFYTNANCSASYKKYTAINVPKP